MIIFIFDRIYKTSMENFSAIGKSILLIGIIIAIIGALIMLSPKIPFIGKLPGDLYYKKKNITIYFPLATSILLSLLISLILYLIRKFF